ncbi:MAG: hypothetical protein AABX71_00010 [Nanoarchaeota archaeon]
MVEKKAEMEEGEILGELKRINIPDTRILQQIMIKSVGQISPDEKQVRKYRQNGAKEPQRIVLLSEEEQRRIYSLSIPFLFPDINWFFRIRNLYHPFSNPTQTDIITWFSKWGGSSSGSPGLSITTNRGIEELVRIFERNSLSFKLGIFSQELFSSHYDGRRNWPSIVSPCVWEADSGFGDGDVVREMEFVPFDHKLEATSYIVLKEVTEMHESTELANRLDCGYIPGYETTSTYSTLTRRDIYRDITTFSLDSGTGVPKYYLQEMLDKKMKKEITESVEERKPYSGRLERKKQRVTDAKATLLHISEPVVVYDPQWIEEALNKQS